MCAKRSTRLTTFRKTEAIEYPMTPVAIPNSTHNTNASPIVVDQALMTVMTRKQVTARYLALEYRKSNDADEVQLGKWALSLTYCELEIAGMGMVRTRSVNQACSAAQLGNRKLLGIVGT
jgi:hypothetical protein